MNNIANIIADVCESLKIGNVSEIGIQSFSFELSASGAAHWLEWQSAQPHYPQFYWHHRDGHEEVVACRQIRLFGNTAYAERFLQQHRQFPKMRLWGLNAWDKVSFYHFYNENTLQYKYEGMDCGESYFFLPRLELHRYRCWF
ncbi:hypothetical protein [Xenorhabdus hominickii]|uniref:hypothetical protein n=1 Tax=Xenorhabdus hominickii TaxID=351679 RepID=UPI0011AB2F27|nr:hypothetical protein [Xenorhabdus hominickii]